MQRREGLQRGFPDLDRRILLQQTQGAEIWRCHRVGKLRNQRSYKFPERMRTLRPLFAGKNVYKFNVGVDYAPHPGNRAILYRNAEIPLIRYNFADLPLAEVYRVNPSQ